LTLAFRVYGVPLPKGNLKPFVRKVRGMMIPIATESNRNVKGWQQLIAEGANRAIASLPDTDRVVLDRGVRMTIAFYLPRPKKFSKRGVFVAHCKAPDLDKLARAVLDALSAIAYFDDAQVTELIARKYYADVGAPPCADIRVEAAPAATFPLLEQSERLVHHG